MTLRAAHNLGLALATSFALMSVLLGGELPAPMWLALLAPWIAWALRRRDTAASTLIGTVVALAAFIWAGSSWIEQGMQGSLFAAAVALIGILVARLITNRTPAHDFQSLVLSLLLVFAGTVLHQQFTYGVVLILYAVTVTWALVTRQLVAGAAQEGARQQDASLALALARRDVVTPVFFGVSAAVAVVILLATSLLFVLFPRVGLGGFGFQGRNSGRLPERVSLFGVPRAVQGGNDVVARLRGVSYNAFIQGLYLRGSVYDQIDAAGFSQSPTLGNMRPSALALAPMPDRAHYEIFLQPVTDQILLSLGAVAAAHVQSGGVANPSMHARLIGVGSTGELMSMTPLSGPLRYSVTGSIASPRPDLQAAVKIDMTPVDAGITKHFLALPQKLDPRIVPLAQKVAGTLPTFAARAQALRRFLLTNFTYTLDQPNTGKSDPLAAFLFEDRRGHCEYFATAFAVLLRSVGVPARVIGGYEGGTWDEDGSLVVFTGNNAHAWVEWYAPGAGWFVDDATPAVDAPTLSAFGAMLERMRRTWDDKVVDFGLDQQMEMIDGLVGSFHRDAALPANPFSWRPPVVIAAVLATLGLGWGLRRRLNLRRKRSVTPLARALIGAIERLSGHPVLPSATLREASENLRYGTADQKQTVQQALQIYEHAQFAAAPRTPVERHWVRQLTQIRRN